ncbi:hypothetical protein [Actinoplanes sp. N902-109]|uniref:hypothetical protein n=1 Tax=Actinoplanes sp. (strain N902-109) TaxID=649831 RepID=UPI000329603A|nr:hypothetical protein [Actinoplanes sp. N902-109]AGL20406.1 hypothetical protein L083_6896 [Actinoplanes sp. N902-109]
MTKRITVSLPDDVADYLTTHANISAVVADAVRARMDRGATTRAILRAAGYHITEEGIARWHEKLRPPSAELRARNARWLEDLEAGRLPKEVTE